MLIAFVVFCFYALHLASARSDKKAANMTMVHNLRIANVPWTSPGSAGLIRSDVDGKCLSCNLDLEACQVPIGLASSADRWLVTAPFEMNAVGANLSKGHCSAGHSGASCRATSRNGRNSGSTMAAGNFSFIFQVSNVELQKVNLTGVDPEAVCNDGSPAFYYFRRFQEVKLSRTWLLFLQGGGWCTSYTGHGDRSAGCQYRHESLTSSLSWKDSIFKHGVVDATASPLSGANLAYLRYCSSDAHMGDRDAFGWKFRGWRIVRAAARHLATSQGLAADDIFLLGGASAGARGAMVHLDSIHEVLPAGVRIFGFLDSPLWVDLSEFNRTWPKAESARATELYVAEEVLKPCHPGEAWKCTFGEFRLPMLKTPFLLLASQSDAFGLRIACDNEALDEAFHKAFAQRVRLVFASLGPHAAVLSSTCWDHAVCETGRFTFEQVVRLDDEFAQGYSQQSMLYRFLKEASSGVEPWNFSQYIDDCEGVDCGRFCLPARPAECRRSEGLTEQMPNGSWKAVSNRRTASFVVIFSCLLCFSVLHSS